MPVSNFLFFPSLFFPLHSLSLSASCHCLSATLTSLLPLLVCQADFRHRPPPSGFFFRLCLPRLLRPTLLAPGRERVLVHVSGLWETLVRFYSLRAIGGETAKLTHACAHTTAQALHCSDITCEWTHLFDRRLKRDLLTFICRGDPARSVCLMEPFPVFHSNVKKYVVQLKQ